MHPIRRMSWIDSAVLMTGLLAMLTFAACVTTEVKVACGKDGIIEDGPGGTCSKHQVNPGTALAANVIAVNPTGGTIPAGSTCSSASGAGQSYQCNDGIPGKTCNLTGGKCRDTYDIQTTVCDCQCR